MLKFVVAFIVLVSVAADTLAQTASSTAGIVARYGWGPTGRIDDAFGVGLELEVLRLGRIVPVGRVDYWDFGIACAEFVRCPSGVTTFAVGIKYRVRSETAAVPYLGGDVGLMEWTSSATGMSVRLRGGVDIRLIGHFDLDLDGSFTRFIKRAGSGRILDNHLTGIGAGLRFWI